MVMRRHLQGILGKKRFNVKDGSVTPAYRFNIVFGPFGDNVLRLYIYSLKYGNVTVRIHESVVRGLQGVSETIVRHFNILNLQHTTICNASFASSSTAICGRKLPIPQVER